MVTTRIHSIKNRISAFGTIFLNVRYRVKEKDTERVYT